MRWRSRKAIRKRSAGSEQATGGMQAFRFPVVVGTPAADDVRRAGAAGLAGDAFNVPFASDRESTDSVIESGATRGEASIPIALKSGGTLQVTLANSVVPQFVTPSERFMNDDALPLADESASRLIVASALQRLRGPYGLKLSFDPDGAIASESQCAAKLSARRRRIRRIRQRSESDPFATAAAVDALISSRAAGRAGRFEAQSAQAAGFLVTGPRESRHLQMVRD